MNQVGDEKLAIWGAADLTWGAPHTGCTPYGQYMVIHDNIWEYMARYSYTWPYICIYYHIWIYAAIYGHILGALDQTKTLGMAALLVRCVL